MSYKRLVVIIPYPFLPAKTGGEWCTLHFLEYISSTTSCDAICVDAYSEKYSHQIKNSRIHFLIRFRIWRYVSPWVLIKIIRFLRQHNYQEVLFEQPWMAWMMFVLKILGYKVSFRAHNIEFTRFKSIGKWYWSLLALYEKFAMHISDEVLFLSEDDLNFAKSLFKKEPKHFRWVPFGITNESVPSALNSIEKNQIKNKYEIAIDKPILLFFSTLNYKPNYTAVNDILDHILPKLRDKKLDFQFILCGNGLPENIQNKINKYSDCKYFGFVPAIEEIIQVSDVLLNPILSGGGVKTKAIEVLGNNGYVISFETGALGIRKEVCGEHLKVIEDNNWDAFSESVASHISNEMRSNIPDDFYVTYSWKNIVERYLKQL